MGKEWERGYPDIFRTVYSPCGQRERSIKRQVNRMLTAANCMMKRPQPSMEEVHIQARRGECGTEWLGLRVSCGQHNTTRDKDKSRRPLCHGTVLSLRVCRIGTGWLNQRRSTPNCSLCLQRQTIDSYSLCEPPYIASTKCSYYVTSID